MSIIGKKVVSKSTNREGTITKANNIGLYVSFEGDVPIKISSDRIKIDLNVDNEFMDEYHDYINGYSKKTKVPVMSFIEFNKKYPIQLNDQQIEAVKALDGPNLILAVPGSGKTTVLTYRLGYLTIARNIKPENILVITYTNAAANEMKDRLYKYFHDDIKGEIHISTINSFSYEIVKSRRKCNTADDEDVTRIVSKLLSKHHIPFYDDIVRIYTGAISLIKSKPREMWNQVIDRIMKERGVSGSFKEIFEEYNNALKEEELIDFNDQNNLAYEILRDEDSFRSLYRNRYRYICVDEAQDTNEVQNRIIKLLAGKEANIFMVGDDDQSIYSFNGSCPNELYNFDKIYPGARIFKIETNYRSTQRIVSFSRNFINRSISNRTKKEMKSVREEGIDVKGIRVSDMIHQAKYIAKELIDNKKETAILYRENSTGIVMAYHLKKNNIPFHFARDDVSIFNTGSFRKVINYLRIINNPRDTDAFGLVFYDIDNDIPFKAYYAMKKRIEHDQNTDVFDQMREYIVKHNYLLNLDTRLWKMNEFRNVYKYYSIEKIINEACEFMLEGNEFQIKKTKNILYSISEPDDNLKSFINRLKEIENLINEKNNEEIKEGVVLSTIHGSKGLEYERVYIVDLYDGVLPTRGAEKEEELLDEEKRLLYVAITRAKDELYILNMKDSESSFYNELGFNKQA